MAVLTVSRMAMDIFVSGAVNSISTKARPIALFNVGENVPDVTSPISLEPIMGSHRTVPESCPAKPPGI